LLTAVWRDRRGAAAPMMAFGIVVILGAAAIGVDLTRVRALQQSLSLAADAAALAAAARLPDEDAARAAALAYVEKNMPSADYGAVLSEDDVEIGHWDPKARTFTPGGTIPASASVTAVRVTARLADANANAVRTLFGGIFGVGTFDVAQQAIAGRTGAPCVISLDGAASGAANLGWNSRLEAFGCGVQVNSSSRRALLVSNAATLFAADICIGGGMASTGSVEPDPREYCNGQTDPLATLDDPKYSGCEYNKKVYSGSKITLNPGVYCGGVTIENGADIILSPGIYIIKDGPLKVLDKSSLSGSEVTIYLTGTKTILNFNDESYVNLSAPITGQYQGILFFQNRYDSNSHKWNGNSTNLIGVVYLPSSALAASSNHLVTPYRSCTVIITKTLEINSGAGVSIDLASSSCREMLPSAYRRGVVLFD
jgi:hypothetical protein